MVKIWLKQIKMIKTARFVRGARQQQHNRCIYSHTAATSQLLHTETHGSNITTVAYTATRQQHHNRCIYSHTAATSQPLHIEPHGSNITTVAYRATRQQHHNRCI